MKNFVFALLPALVLLGMSSCMSDSCSFEGKWLVKNADLQSATMDSSILNMAEQEYMGMSYEFAKDTVKINSLTNTMTGSWQFDDSKQEITWTATAPDGQEMKETNFVESCTPIEITLSQRLPNDTTKKELARIILTLQKEEGNKGK